MTDIYYYYYFPIIKSHKSPTQKVQRITLEINGFSKVILYYYQYKYMYQKRLLDFADYFLPNGLMHIQLPELYQKQYDWFHYKH